MTNQINIGIYALTWFLSFTIGSLLSFPLGVLFVRIAKFLKYKIFERLSSLLIGISQGILTIIGAFYFLKLFELSINWWLSVFIVLGFIYDDGRRILGSLHNKELFYHELLVATGTVIAIPIISYFFIYPF